MLAGAASARHLLGPYSIGYGHQPADLGVAVHQEPEVGNYHFFPALKSLVDPPVWIGIVLVVRGIVVTKLEVNVAALRCFQRRSVSNLSVEIVSGIIEHSFVAPIGIGDRVLSALAAHMCMGPQASSRKVFFLICM